MEKTNGGNKQALGVLDAFTLALPAEFVWTKEMCRLYERLVRLLVNRS
ncbi:MAG: hypothetical protein HW407_1873 [Bacteroidetes bacterium]|nr:hypothetical protein [Bacteroidota bacterium]